MCCPVFPAIKMLMRDLFCRSRAEKDRENEELKKQIEYMLKLYFQAIYGSDVKINYVLLDETQ